MRTPLALLIAAALPGLAHADCEEGVVVINEFAPAASPGASAEWVELLAVGDDVDVSGWQVQATTSPTTSWGTVFLMPPGSLLTADVPFLVGRESVVLPAGADGITVISDATNNRDMGNASSSSDAVRLVNCDELPIDVVVYGAANASGQIFTDESGADVLDDRLAPKPTGTKSLARVQDGVDSDDGAMDFVSGTPTPGALNAEDDVVEPTGPCEEGVAGEIVVNEFVPDPSGADGGLEWVELYNSGAQAVALDGWTIQKATSTDSDSGDGNWSSGVALGSVTLEAGAWLVIAESSVDVPNGIDAIVLGSDEKLEFGNASSSADAMRLVDCEGAAMDTVVYGSPNSDFFRDDRATVAADADTAPDPASGASLARRIDGLDSNVSADDFAIESAPTMGTANRDLVCRAESGPVVINEFLPDVSGEEGTTEFVELYNRGTVAINVSSWQVGKITSRGATGLNDTVLASIPAGTTLEPGGFLVVGGLFAEVADVVVEDFDLGSGSKGDIVFLDSCAGKRVDAVLYGGDNEDGLPDGDGFFPDEGAPDPSTDQCIARIADGVDTHVSSADFVATSFCSPGKSNARKPGPGTKDDDVGGGCGGSGSEPVVGDAPVVDPNDPNGCAMSPSPRLAPAVWLFFAALVRRRRTA